jgi:alpha-tubulin suppressor-like RCC1 family protein
LGGLGLNTGPGPANYISSPTQVGSLTTWASTGNNRIAQGVYSGGAVNTSGELWVWGRNEYGALGLNDGTHRSSPTQLPGTTWMSVYWNGNLGNMAIKTDGTLWGWGKNTDGSLGQGSQTNYSSPVQIPGTTWKRVVVEYNGGVLATKTDGTLWGWGDGGQGQIAQNNESAYSSPRQIPGTKWLTVGAGGMRGCCTQDML